MQRILSTINPHKFLISSLYTDYCYLLSSVLCIPQCVKGLSDVWFLPCGVCGNWSTIRSSSAEKYLKVHLVSESW